MSLDELSGFVIVGCVKTAPWGQTDSTVTGSPGDIGGYRYGGDANYWRRADLKREAENYLREYTCEMNEDEANIFINDWVNARMSFEEEK